jgi:hypothetical protein
MRTMHRQAYEQALGPEGAALLMQSPILNSGAFAARRNNPTWDSWATLCQKAMARGPTKHSEQVALNVALYSRGDKPFYPLPASCNWICVLACPLWNKQTHQLVEPFLPHEPLGLLHITSYSGLEPFEVLCLGGGSRKMGYRRKLVLEAMRAEPIQPSSK